MASVNAEAFFVSRGELLGWLNSCLGLRLQKVEETANGAIACQLLDALHPGLVPLRRVDFNATSEYDAIANYKVLQDCFLKLGVDKPVDVAKLVKARPLDNTEFMQWFKAYWDRQTGGMGGGGVEGYDGPGRRAGASKTGDLRGGKSVGGGGGAGALPVSAAAAAAAPVVKPRAVASVPAAAAPQRRIAAAAAAPTRQTAAAPSSAASSSVQCLRQEAEDARQRAEAASRERDFYWSKLRAIEVLCGAPGASAVHPVLKTVEAILYAPTAEDGEAVLEGALAELEQPGGGGKGGQAAAATAAEPRAPSPLARAGAAAAAGAGAVAAAGSAELPPLGAMMATTTTTTEDAVLEVACAPVASAEAETADAEAAAAEAPPLPSAPSPLAA